MHSLAHDYPVTLLAEREAPCLSLSQPTHRQHPDNAEDPVRFRNLVKQLAASLRAKYPTRDIPTLLRPFEASPKIAISGITPVTGSPFWARRFSFESTGCSGRLPNWQASRTAFMLSR